MGEFEDKYTPISSSGRVLTVTGTIQILPLEKNVNRALVVVRDASGNTDKTKAISYTLDGGDPDDNTGDNGFIVGEKDFFVLENQSQIAAFKAIAFEPTTTVKLYVEYFSGNE